MQIRWAAAANVLLLVALFFHSGANAQSAKRAEVRPSAKAEKFYRTELYLGRSRSNGPIVSDEEWNGFLSETVTPRFPDGFTAIKAAGQYRDKTGKIVSEPSEVLIILYPSSSKKVSRAKIEEIRTAYIQRFGQESVLRVDLPKSVRVLF